MQPSQTKSPHLFANLKHSPSQNTPQNGIIIQEKSGVKFWGGYSRTWNELAKPNMSWDSMQMFFYFFFRFPSMSILVLNQRGLSTIKGKNVLCDKICLTSRQKCDCGFDKRSQTCTSRHNHLGKFWRLTTLFWKAKVSYNTIATLRITTGKKKHILHCYSV